jgi:hypothetical protein
MSILRDYYLRGRPGKALEGKKHDGILQQWEMLRGKKVGAFEGKRKVRLTMFI